MPQPNIQNPSKASKKAQAAEWLKPAGTCLGLLLFLTGSNQLWRGIAAAHVDNTPVDFGTHGLNYFWNLYFTGGKGHDNIIAGAALLGGALGMVALAWGLFDPTPPKAEMKLGMFYGIGAVAAVFIALFILEYGMHQIGGYDQSNLIDSSWRLYKGQTVYVDFPFTLPIAYTLGGKFSFQWFGVHWRSFIEMMALFSAPTFAWSLFLLARLFGRSWTTLLWALAMQMFSPMMAAYWTYNPITAVTAVIYTLSAAYWLRCPQDKIAVASYGASLWLMATMKPNVAGILIPGISLLLFASARHRWKVVWVSLGAFALFLVFLWINNMSFTGTIAGYLSVASRGASLAPFLIDLNPLEKRMALVVLMSILLPAVLALSQGERSKPSLISWTPAIVMLCGLCLFIANHENKPIGEATIFAPLVMALYLGRKSLRSLDPWIPTFVLLAGLYGFITNSEQKLVDAPPGRCAALLLAADLRSARLSTAGPLFQLPLWWNRYLALVCVVLGGVALAQGTARDRIQSIGPVQFFEWDDSRHIIRDGFFKGVHCGDVFDEMLKEVTAVANRNPSSTFWFGPRMQWGYAAFDKPSPLHEPVIWDPDTMFDNSHREIYFNNFLQNRLQILILFKNDLTHYTQEEVQRISQLYNVDQSFPALTVLRLKN